MIVAAQRKSDPSQDEWYVRQGMPTMHLPFATSQAHRHTDVCMTFILLIARQHVSCLSLFASHLSALYNLGSHRCGTKSSEVLAINGMASMHHVNDNSRATYLL